MKELSDFELSKDIAEALDIKNLRINEERQTIEVVWGELVDAHDLDPWGMAAYLNYCNNWNDLMDLVEKYRLIIVPYKNDLWEAYPESGEFVVYNKKYRRAGAECLLKVLQGDE